MPGGEQAPEPVIEARLGLDRVVQEIMRERAACLADDGLLPAVLSHEGELVPLVGDLAKGDAHGR